MAILSTTERIYFFRHNLTAEFTSEPIINDDLASSSLGDYSLRMQRLAAAVISLRTFWTDSFIDPRSFGPIPIRICHFSPTSGVDYFVLSLVGHFRPNFFI